MARWALWEAFGVSEFEDIRMLNTAKLTSAHVYRIVVRGCPYLLRVITRTDANTDPTRQFKCMKIAAEPGLAPRVLYASIEDRVSLTDFLEERPLPAAEAAVRLAMTLQALHALSPFPRLVNDYDTAPTFLLRASGRVRSVWPPMKRRCSTGRFICTNFCKMYGQSDFRTLFESSLIGMRGHSFRTGCPMVKVAVNAMPAPAVVAPRQATAPSSRHVQRGMPNPGQ